MERAINWPNPLARFKKRFRSKEDETACTRYSQGNEPPDHKREDGRAVTN
jgi:hypothetical protein